MAIPIPGHKPDISNSGSGESFIDFIFDTGKSALSELASFELQKIQAEKMAEIREIEDSFKTQNQQVLAGYQQPTLLQGNNQNIVGITSALAIGLLITAGVLIFTKG